MSTPGEVANRAAQLQPKSESNQCDGCRRGLPVDEHGMHRGPGGFWAGDLQFCTMALYE